MNATVDQANDFHALRNNTMWADASTNDKTASLYRASDYINAIYMIEGHETEASVKTAVIMLASEMLDAPLTVRAHDAAILSTEFGAGNGAYDEKTTYAKPTSDDRYPLITAILSPIPRRVDHAASTAKTGRTLTSFRLSRA